MAIEYNVNRVAMTIKTRFLTNIIRDNGDEATVLITV